MRLKITVFNFIVICLGFGCLHSSNAQVNDAGLWTSVTIEKKVFSKFSLALNQELRFNENISELGTAFTELGGNYRIRKFLSIGASYRFIQKRKVNDFYSMRHRYNIDLAIRHKIKNLSLALRERFQTQYADIYSREKGMLPEHYLRSKLTLKYDLDKKYAPFLSGEFFFQLSNVEGNELDNVRYAAGFDYEFSKRSSVELFYVINKAFNVNEPVTDYVTGIGFNYSF